MTATVLRKSPAICISVRLFLAQLCADRRTQVCTEEAVLIPSEVGFQGGTRGQVGFWVSPYFHALFDSLHFIPKAHSYLVLSYIFS